MSVNDYDAYLNFYIGNVHISDIEGSVYDLYREKILSCNDMKDVENVRAEFKHLVHGNKLSIFDIYTDINELKSDIQSDMSHFDLSVDGEKLNVCLPHLMVKGHIIAQKFECPEYVAIAQYIRSQLECIDKQRETYET